MNYNDASIEEIDKIMESSWQAYSIYKNSSLQQRAGFMKSIAEGLEAESTALIETAARETALPEARLKAELTRTRFQLTSYAEACASGKWMDIRISRAKTEKNPPAPDLRKMLVPLGPVVVFGAANFPFAYSTAGGDTACALAAGCPVVVKAHPGHAETSTLVAEVIRKAAATLMLPDAVFMHVYGASNEIGTALVQHPRTKAVGFTGSYNGGRALFDLAAKRKDPIPVFAEMGSVNPVFLLPGKLKDEAEKVAEMYASSITLGVGQFCTNPGLIFALNNNDLGRFMTALQNKIEQVQPATMLNRGIFNNYVEKRAIALAQDGVEQLAVSPIAPQDVQGLPTIAVTDAENYLDNPVLHQEVFGPYSLIIRCRNMEEMLLAVTRTEGQLTATVMANDEDLRSSTTFLDAVREICGRFVINGVPTGVEVSLAMHHGGPFPATTDSRFTSVGADGIRRFARPLCFQNWPEELLPLELKDANPLNLERWEE